MPQSGNQTEVPPWLELEMEQQDLELKLRLEGGSVGGW